uniref:Uncharacterized protein n=1 Tax=Candidatus Kentrum sp. TUN TaxID=2126343 RepID=A0A450ZAS8_9GAMM|nr:MAG: hypothetical protein BECKTUN1418D_GA0071000_10031 [Candidatus Kentron sp. TUN]VFK53409.1 MAG: hypothetical protein BECKTUN1418F_GA0071002_10208 [Candidatus Kentron sp. TUN]VFK54382.1 MAG: hypothetical protein BECKTUN1418E_GA0071001_10218 [Candidatus Kentron sp. TUN]
MDFQDRSDVMQHCWKNWHIHALQPIDRKIDSHDRQKFFHILAINGNNNNEDIFFTFGIDPER